MTTPADEIRTAAAHLRALATAATPGPWTTDSSIPYGHRVGSSDEADWVAWTGEHGEDGSQADAAYIAAMGPPVALALADWLDATATWARAYPEMAHDHDRGACDDYACDVMGRALTAARAVNGGQL